MLREQETNEIKNETIIKLNVQNEEINEYGMKLIEYGTHKIDIFKN